MYALKKWGNSIPTKHRQQDAIRWEAIRDGSSGGSKIEKRAKDITTEEVEKLRGTLEAEIKLTDTSSGAQPECKLDKVVDALANISTKPELNHTVNSVATEIPKFSGSSDADSSAEEWL